MLDLQDLVEDLAAELGRPIAVDDRRFRLLAHSAHEDVAEADAVRLRSILSRHTSPEVAGWLESLGLLTACAPLETPANDALGMGARVVVPVRHGDVLLGFLWVSTDGRPLDDAARGRLADAAARVESSLWARRAAEDARGAAAAALLGGSAEALSTLGWPAEARLCAVAWIGGEEVTQRAARRWGSGDFTAAPGGTSWTSGVQHVAEGVVRLGTREPDAVVGALSAAGAADAGAGSVTRGAAGLADSARRARLTLLLGGGAFEELGAWGTLADLWDRAGRPAPPPLATALEDHDDLLAAATAFLEAGGDVAAAAAGVPVHRATLYRRLQRVEELTGLDLELGDDRLALHLALRLRQLSRAAAAFRDEAV